MDSEDLNLLANVNFLLRQDLVARFRRLGFDVTAEEWSVLETLQGLPGLTVTDLAQRNHRDKTTTTRMMDRLIGKGLAERRTPEKDRRVQTLFLTRKGYEVCSDLKSVAAQVAKDAADGVAPDFTNNLRVMLANLKAQKSK